MTKNLINKTLINKTLAGGAFALTIGLSTAAMAASGWSTGVSHLHAGPDNKYPVVATIAANSVLHVNGCLSDQSWCDVSTHGHYGWVRGSHVQIMSGHRHVGLAHADASVMPAVVTYDTHQYWDAHYRGQRFYATRAQYGYATETAPAEPTGRPPMDRAGNTANPSVSNNVNHMLDDHRYSK